MASPTASDFAAALLVAGAGTPALAEMDTAAPVAHDTELYLRGRGMTAPVVPAITRLRLSNADRIPSSAAADAPELFSAGTVAEHYDIGRILGSGEFGCVMLARRRATGEELAVKKIRRAVEGGKTRSAALLNELRIMAHVRDNIHAKGVPAARHILRYVEAFEEPGHWHIVMEKCDGGELFERICSRGHYDETVAANAIANVLKALAALHAVGVVHRDLKPENLLLSSHGDDNALVVADFGLALLNYVPPAAGSGIAPAHLAGTPIYLAPEAILYRDFSPSIDVWGAGVILYILLSGMIPFVDDRGRTALFSDICGGNYEFTQGSPWDYVSEGAKSCVRWLMGIDPAQRPSAEEALSHPWIVGNQRTEHLPQTIAHLRTFNARRKFRGTALALAWASLARRRDALHRLLPSRALSYNEMEAVRAAFWRVAPTGRVRRDVFNRALEESNFSHGALADALFAVFDEDGNGEVEYREFISGLAVLRHGGEPALRVCFKMYDRDNNGSINREEFAHVLVSVSTISPDEDEAALEDRVAAWGHLFDRVDTDHDGVISYEEFAAGVKSEPLLAAAVLRPSAWADQALRASAEHAAALGPRRSTAPAVAIHDALHKIETDRGGLGYGHPGATVTGTDGAPHGVAAGAMATLASTPHRPIFTEPLPHRTLPRDNGAAGARTPPQPPAIDVDNAVGSTSIAAASIVGPPQAMPLSPALIPTLRHSVLSHDTVSGVLEPSGPPAATARSTSAGASGVPLGHAAVSSRDTVSGVLEPQVAIVSSQAPNTAVAPTRDAQPATTATDRGCCSVM